ncbi:zinc finger (CCCH type) protein, putative [Eimeria mitis]|uniref:Zinc finger (CCCH type) protein, putative n=1 Tax=Eimeria mitis TaxID=44415 RepID=U6JTU6_9EIME|nr:zinc finger (CCCH type) protein, putative [Eimeria mitis]CDJ26938.1 zinc finger (CCCH type) protein, putative [Eimeria mitis]
MFVRRAAPKGVRKRPTPTEAAASQTEAEPGAAAADAAAAAKGQEGENSAAAATGAAAAASEGSDEEHANIAKRKKARNILCKHFVVGRTKTEAPPKEKPIDALAQQSNPDLDRLRRQAEGEEDISSSEGSSDDSEEEEDEDGLPFACLSCRKKWQLDMNPIVTRCGHYFCESCALNNFKKNRQCVQCGADTHGILNTAYKLISKIEALQKQGEHNTQDKQRIDSSSSSGSSSSSSANNNDANNNTNASNNSSDQESSEDEEEDEPEDGGEAG